jgi:hypothetical protein
MEQEDRFYDRWWRSDSSCFSNSGMVGRPSRRADVPENNQSRGRFYSGFMSLWCWERLATARATCLTIRIVEAFFAGSKASPTVPMDGVTSLQGMARRNQITRRCA